MNAGSATPSRWISTSPWRGSASAPEGDTHRAPAHDTTLARQGDGTRTLTTEVRGGDVAGRLYCTGFRSNANPTAPRDSAPLLRWTPATDAIDTLTWVRIPVQGMRRSEANPDSMINVRPDPFEWRDVWSVAPNGRVVVVRGDDYHVEWYDGYDGAPPRVDQQGRVWIERSRTSGTDLVTYDLFDNTGSAVLTVQLAIGARAVGFGAGAVYVTKPVENGRYEVTKGRWSGR